MGRSVQKRFAVSDLGKYVLYTTECTLYNFHKACNFFGAVNP